MKKIYFISDVHLAFQETPGEADKRKKLIGFLHHLHHNAKELVIVGDFFDFWFEWYHVVPKYWFPILHLLRNLVDAGISVTYVAGNHDFFMGTFLQREVGIACRSDDYTFVVDSKRFFVAHGDGLAKKDHGYRLLKRILRHPISNFLYKTLIPADLGMQVAKWTSHSSRRLKFIDRRQWSEEYHRYARDKFAEGFDFVVLGHLHYPMHREEGGKVYINCGDWINHFTFGVYDGRTLLLQKWPHGAG
jgi:UDP-2,3-diacylglucosamine hydrolase